MAIISSIMSWLMKKRIHQMELFIKYPHEVQQEWFRKLIQTAAQTEWGLKHDYAGIKSYAQFAERVPLQDYEGLKPYIVRLRHGEPNPLWPSEVKWYAKSSGTSNDKSKFIPVTQEAMEECHFKGGKDLLSIYCSNNPDTRLFDGKLLSLGGSHTVNAFSNDSFYGDLSAIIIQNLPFWIELFRTPDLSVALMDEWETKIEKMALATMKEDVTNISGVPSWTLVLLRKILEISGRKSIVDIWPNLELFVHGAVNFTPYREQFHALIPNPGMRYYETYNASEGFFGIQDRNGTDEMLLMLDYGIFYEFIAQGDTRAVPLYEVVEGVQYAMVITTNAGLWRYQIGDTVVFTSTRPYRIRITGRTSLFINAFGEELMIDNAEKAIAAACRDTGASVVEYTASPLFFTDRTGGAHEWFIEFDREPDDVGRFAQALDNALKAVNSDYEAKRHKDMNLRMPIVRVLERDTFYRWLKSKNKLGGQHKVPRLANNRGIADELIRLNGGPYA